MSDISNIELRRLDLTLLLVFLGLMRRRKAAEAARELGLTQPAVSHALGRLRDIFGDPLFLRRPHGMEPTAVAHALEPQVQAAVDALRAALGGVGPFAPGTATGEVRISAWDSVQALLAPGLVARVAEAAPELRLSFRMFDRDGALDALEAGAIDLAVGFFPNAGERVLSEPLYAETYAVAGRPDVIGAGLDLDAYLALPHVLASPRGDFTGIVDMTLAAQGLSRRVVATVPQVVPALATVARMGAVTTLPAHVARRFAPAFGLVTCAPPVALRAFTVAAVRHRRNAKSPRLGWLTDRLRATVAEATGGEG